MQLKTRYILCWIVPYITPLQRNVCQGNLNSLFQLDHQVDISTLPLKRIIWFETTWCTFNPLALLASKILKSDSFHRARQYSKVLYPPPQLLRVEKVLGVIIATKLEKDGANLKCWHERDTLHLDHSHELICEAEIGWQSMATQLDTKILPRYQTTIELAFNLSRVLQELVVFHTMLSLFNKWSVLRQVWPSMNRYTNVLCSNLHTLSRHAPKTYQTWKILHAKQPTPNQRSTWIKGPLYSIYALVFQKANDKYELSLWVTSVTYTKPFLKIWDSLRRWDPLHG